MSVGPVGSSGFQWPPLPILDPDEAALILSERLQEAYDDLEAQRLRLLAIALADGRPAVVRPYFEEFKTAIVAFQLRVADDVDAFLRLHLGPVYEQGVSVVGPMTWTAQHVTALTNLARDTYNDFLARSEAAGRTSRAFAQAVRDAAGKEIPKTAAGGRTALDAAKRLEDRLISQYGITAVTYRDGSRVSVRTYTRMAARTKSAVAYNAGTLNELHAQKQSHVEVFDGPDCGWTAHDDPDGADGSIRTLAAASANPVAHPNCRRAFGPRPDIATDREAANARPTPRSNSPEPLPALPVERVAFVRPAEVRRAARAAKRAGRVSGATTDQQVRAIVSSITGQVSP